jgi:hypothetical protein
MVTSLILTLVILLCLFLAVAYIINPAPFDQPIKWCLTAIVGVLAIAGILKVWGLF